MRRRITYIGLALISVSLAGRTQDTQDPNKLIGSWKLVKAVYGGRPFNFNGLVEIKNVTDSQFMWFRYKEGSSTIVAAGGGPYSANGDTYLEKLDYGLGGDFKVVKGHIVSLKWKLGGDTWHTSGKLNNGLAIEEDWQRLPRTQIGQ